MMKPSTRRVRAIFRKELREYRRTGSIVGTMAVVPLIFIIAPLARAFALPVSAAATLRHENLLVYLMAIPAIVPATLAAYSVVGERQQGTLEPILTTPLRREEFLLGKALASFIPSVVVAYAVFALFLACVELFAQPVIASALVRGPELLAQLAFTPLLAGWSIWAGIAISTRSNDVRAAQQLAGLASLPPIAITSLISYNVIHPTLRLVLGFGIALLLLNRVGWRITSKAFDRERLVTGSRSRGERQT
ncbi:MAG: type transporter [Acidimicrobiaceae bacterium]|nr:type transporter [Acidimicrobiaceae bacterium]